MYLIIIFINLVNLNKIKLIPLRREALFNVQLTQAEKNLIPLNYQFYLEALFI